VPEFSGREFTNFFQFLALLHTGKNSEIAYKKRRNSWKFQFSSNVYPTRVFLKLRVCRVLLWWCIVDRNKFYRGHPLRHICIALNWRTAKYRSVMSRDGLSRRFCEHKDGDIRLTKRAQHAITTSISHCNTVASIEVAMCYNNTVDLRVNWMVYPYIRMCFHTVL